MVDNQVVKVSNYATNALQDTLYGYAGKGYKLVNTILARDKYGVNVMYLFFTKETRENNE